MYSFVSRNGFLVGSPVRGSVLIYSPGVRLLVPETEKRPDEES